MSGAGAVRQEDAAAGGGDAAVRGGVLYCAREITGVPKKYAHAVWLLDRTLMDVFGDKYCDFPRVERWKYELLVASVENMVENLETFRDDYQDSDSVRKGVQEWQHLSAQNQAAAAEQAVASLPEQAQ